MRAVELGGASRGMLSFVGDRDIFLSTRVPTRSFAFGVVTGQLSQLQLEAQTMWSILMFDVIQVTEAEIEARAFRVCKVPLLDFWHISPFPRDQRI